MDASLFFSFSLFHSGRSSLAGIIMQKIPVRNSPRAPPPRCGRSYPPRNWRNSQRSRCIYTGSCSWPRYEVSRFSERLPAGAGRKVSYRIAARTDEPGCRDWIQRELTDIVYKWKPPLRGVPNPRFSVIHEPGIETKLWRRFEHLRVITCDEAETGEFPDSPTSRRAVEEIHPHPTPSPSRRRWKIKTSRLSPRNLSARTDESAINDYHLSFSLSLFLDERKGGILWQGCILLSL